MKKILFLLAYLSTYGLLYGADDCHIVYGMWPIYSPYEWVDSDGTPSGMNIDILEAVSKAANCTYEIKYGEYSENINKLKDGRVDMISASPVAELQDDALSVPTSIVKYRYIFSRLNSPYMSTLEDLRGKTVLVGGSSYSHRVLREMQSQYGFTIIAYESHAKAVEEFIKGGGDGLITTMELAMNAVKDIEEQNLRSNFYPILPAIYGFHINKNNQALYERISEGMEEIKQSGEYFEIIQKWFAKNNNPKWPKYLLISLAAVAVATIGVLLWNKTLQSNVRKKTASLSYLSSLFQLVLDSMPECIYLIDFNGNVSWTNVNNLQKKAISVENIKFEINKSIKENKKAEFTRLSEDASTWRIVLIPLKKGNDRLLVIISDITDNIRLRDEALMSARLAAIGEMATTVAHEINNPVAIIALNMDFIKITHNGLIAYAKDYPDYFEDMSTYVEDWRDGESFTTAVSDINESIGRIKNVIKELKYFSVQRANIFEVIDIKKPVEDAIHFTNFFIKKHTEHFIFSTDENLSKIYGNALHIEQVVVNLIQNSCYALTDKNQKIICSLENSQNNKYVKLTVQDEGCGIAEEISKEIWAPFFTTRKKEGGTGLGMAVISRIVKEHKGYHTISSTPGSGTIISLYFPAAKGEA